MLLHHGNTEYAQGNFQQATRYYQALLNRYGYSAESFYNLANSLARQGEIGKAILNYQRALLLNPDDPDILGNLEYVRKNCGLFAGSEPGPLVRKIHAIGVNSWSCIALFSLIILAMTLSAFVLMPARSKALRWIWPATLILLIIGIGGTIFCYNPGNMAVIMSGEQKMFISPFADAAINGSIQEGRLVRTGKKHQGFIYIEDETGRKGWIPDAAQEPIILTPR